MIDVDEIIPKNREEYIKFLEGTDIIAIDDILLYNGVKYQLEKYDIYKLNLRRTAMGYPENYLGPEKNPGDAENINGMMLTTLNSILMDIDSELENNKLIHKIIN
jgi:hypothetical protein